MLLGRVLGSALLLIFLGPPLLAAPIQVSLLLEEMQGSAKVATVVVSPVVSDLVGESPKAVAIETEVPGKVELKLDRDYAWRLSVQADGLWGPETLIPGGSGLPEVSVRLVPTSTLTGRVEAMAGQPPPAELGVRFRSFGETPAARSTVDETVVCPIEEGRWRCEVPGGTFDLRLHAAGFISHYLWEQELPPKESIDLGLIRLMPGAAISGRLLTDDGSALRETTRVHATPEATQPGTLRAESRHQSLATEARVTDRGFFQLSGLRPGAYVLHAEQEGFVPLRSLPIVVIEASETELSEPLVLTRPAELRLGIEPPADTAGEPWTVVLSSPPATEPASSGRSATDGTWTASALAPGKYFLMVTDSNGSRVASEEILVKGPVTDHWLVLSLTEVEGIVTLGGEPIEAEVFFGGKSGMTSVRMKADEEGRFYGALPRPGTWRVDVLSQLEGVFRRLRAVEVEPLAGSSLARVEIELPGTRLEGEVVDLEGQGITRATVLAIPVPEKPGDPAEPPSHTRTQQGGLFFFEGFEPATYRLQAMRSVSGKKQVSEPVEISLREEDPFSLVRLVLGRPVAFRGRVLSGNGGVSGAMVMAMPLGGAPGVLLPNSRTSADGRFEINLPEGSSEAELTILAPGFLFYRQIVTLPEQGQEVPLILEQRNGGTLVFQPSKPVDLLDGRGLPWVVRADGAQVDLRTLSLWSSLNHRQPFGDLIEIPAMPSGAYQVCWPRSTARRKQGHGPDCDGGYLPANGRLEIAQRSQGEHEDE